MVTMPLGHVLEPISQTSQVADKDYTNNGLGISSSEACGSRP